LLGRENDVLEFAVFDLSNVMAGVGVDSPGLVDDSDAKHLRDEVDVTRAGQPLRRG